MIKCIAPGLKIQEPKIQQLLDIAHKATTKYPTPKLNTTRIENLYGQFGSWGV